jgi:hypothetical protein
MRAVSEPDVDPCELVRRPSCPRTIGAAKARRVVAEEIEIPDARAMARTIPLWRSPKSVERRRVPSAIAAEAGPDFKSEIVSSEAVAS